jgi:hypothetical protein
LDEKDKKRKKFIVKKKQYINNNGHIFDSHGNNLTNS